MARYPNIWTLQSLFKCAAEVCTEIRGQLVPVRPLGFPSLHNRFRCAWMVFTGHADAVIWPEDQQTKHCEYLEQVSDKIRRGEPVGLRKAIAAIDYQGRLKAERDAVRASKWWRRVLRWFMRPAAARRTPRQPE